MWRPIGWLNVGPFSGELPIGRLSGALTNGNLPIRGRVTNQGGPGPLSFAVLSLRDDEGTRPMDGCRWWPRSDPSTVQLGPAIGSAVSGSLLFKPRAYNTRWISVGIPAPWWGVAFEAWLPEGSTTPTFTPSGVTDGSATFTLTGPPVGPAGARALAQNG